MAQPHSVQQYAGVRLGIQSALLDGDSSLALTMVLDLMGEGVPLEVVLFDVLAPIQVDVGTRWVNDDYRIADEHAVSGGMETLISLLSGSFEMPEEGPLVLVASAEGDTHSLPGRMLAAHLLAEGWRVTNLGATVPADDLGAHLEETASVALLLSCSMASNLRGARDCVRAAHQVGVPVIIGGRALGSDDRRAAALGADAWLSDPRDVPLLLAAWDPEVGSREESGHGAEADALEALWPTITAAAADAIAAGEANPRRIAKVRADLNLIAGNVDGALLVADPSIVKDYVMWHDVFVATRPDSVDSATLVSQLRAGLPASAVHADEYLAAATDAGATN